PACPSEGRMLHRFQGLVDPFATRAGSAGAPASDAWRFILQNLRPFRGVVAASLLCCVIGAGIEVWLIGYAGRLVDRLAATAPAELWDALGPELLAVAALVLL